MYGLRNTPSHMRWTREVEQYEERLTQLATEENHRERNMLDDRDSLNAFMCSSSASLSSMNLPMGAVVRIAGRASI